MQPHIATLVKELRDAERVGEFEYTLEDTSTIFDRAADTLEQMDALLDKYKQYQRSAEEENYIRPVCVESLISEIREILKYSRNEEQVIVLENTIRFIEIMSRALTEDEIFQTAVALSNILAVQRCLDKRLEEASQWIETNRRKDL